MIPATETLGRAAPPPASISPTLAAGAGPRPAGPPASAEPAGQLTEPGAAAHPACPIPAIRPLHDAVARLESAASSGRPPPPPLATGLAEIDRALPGGGLARGAVHDIAAAHVLDGAAVGFLARLLARLPSFGCGPSPGAAGRRSMPTAFPHSASIRRG